MLKNYKDVARVILGIIIFCTVFFLAEKSGIRDSFINSSALVSDSIENNFLSYENNFYDFGRVSMRDGFKKHLFELKNEGEGDIFIKKVYTTCRCLEVTLKNKSFKVGPFSFRDYLSSVGGEIIVRRGETMVAELDYHPILQGILGIGLSEPFAVLEDSFGNKINLRISALVFP